MIKISPLRRPVNKEYEPHIIPGKLIDGVNIIEHICEVFDSAVELLPETAILYGGAVRDSLAGVPIAGDLDVLLAPEDLHYAVNSFVRSPRWILINGKTSYKDYEGISFDYTAIHSFKTVNDKVVQLIPSTTVDTAVITDIICCGVVSDVTGNVYEAVNGAYRDCQEMVLNINEMAYKVMSVENLSNRIDKLVKRGWKNNISMETVIKEIEKVKSALEKAAAMARRRRNKASVCGLEKTGNLGGKVQQHPSDIYRNETKLGILEPIRWANQEVDKVTIKMPKPNKFQTEGIADTIEVPEVESTRSKQATTKRPISTNVYKKEYLGGGVVPRGGVARTMVGRISVENADHEVPKLFTKRELESLPNQKVTTVDLMEFANSYLEKAKRDVKINKLEAIRTMYTTDPYRKGRV